MKVKDIFVAIGALVASMASGLVAILLHQKLQKPTATPTSPPYTPPSKEAVKAKEEKIEAIKAQTDQEVIEKATPEQKSFVDEAVKEQVSKAMAAADKYKRRKKE